MIKIIKREIEPREIQMCKCCGGILMANEELYLLKVGKEDFFTKDFESGSQTIDLCKSCLIKVKDTIVNKMREK